MKAATLALLLALPAPALADDVLEALDTARTAYEDGDVQYAAQELEFAMQLLDEMKAAGFADLLPEPMDGWRRELDSEAGAMAGMFGGGTAANANYFDDEGGQFSIMMMADSPMIAMIGGMLANPAMTGGKMVRVGRERFVEDEDGEVTGLVGGRIMIQGSGQARDAMIAHLETMDFRAIADAL